MPWDSIDRRHSGAVRFKLPESQPGTRERRRSSQFAKVRLFDAATGFHTMPALTAFMQYEIDGSVQTDLNERFVTPLCLAAIEVAPPENATEGLQAERFVQDVSAALRQVTRVADRVARHAFGYVSLLRRTMSASVRDFYAPRLAREVSEACAELGAVTTSVGIASLIEHAARSPDHLVRMAQRALEVALKEPGSVVVYDFRAMPLD